MNLAPMTIYWMVFLGVVGLNVGSFLNVAIARLPLEKSLLWPGSRCMSCLQAIRWYDNIPILSYLLLRGRCRTCGARFSPRYLFVELATGLGFVGIFYLEMVANVHDWPVQGAFWIQQGWYPMSWWAGYAFHVVLFSFLMAASFCDLSCREIPLPLTLTGATIGFVGALFMPWPWPRTPAPIIPIAEVAGGPFGNMLFFNRIDSGIYPWPFWLPLPAMCGLGGNLLTGLFTGLCGLLVGTFLLRLIGFVFGRGLGKEALGLGDADLMMMAGAFLGWQPVVVAFFIAVAPALVFAAVNRIVHNDNSLPFGPSLAIGLMTACLAWKWIGPQFQLIFFNATIVFGFAGFLVVFLLLAALLLRWFRT
jgi:leader peptidase (prepilin peptidase)/N-methyltransferase